MDGQTYTNIKKQPESQTGKQTERQRERARHEGRLTDERTAGTEGDRPRKTDQKDKTDR